MYRYEQRKEPCVVLVWHRDRSRRHMHSALQPHSRPIAFADIALADRQLNRGLDRFFSFFEVRRIAAGRSTSIFWDGSDDRIDPDAPRVVIVEPPTGEATPHHEDHLGSEGLDQGQNIAHSRHVSDRNHAERTWAEQS
jgi:hypothetical protein